jgi:signal transduction histidine kinase
LGGGSTRPARAPGPNTVGDRRTIGGVGVESSLWRAIAVFRAGALAYVVYLTARAFGDFDRPVLAWVAVAGMGAWTAFATWVYAAPARRGWPMLTADLAVTGATLYASRYVIDPIVLAQGASTLPMAWVASPVLAVAVGKGRRYAAAGALVLFGIDGLIRGWDNDVVVNGLVLLLLAGLVIGYLNTIAVTAERRMRQATQLEAATRERDRLARTIHDSVLQGLALIQRRAAELGGSAAELGRLAGEQGAVLRTLVVTGPVDRAGTGAFEVDLRALLEPYGSPVVTVAAPATVVPLPLRMAGEVEAAVVAALANVSAHAGPEARAFVLIEDEDDTVTVTVRDDGAGMAANRLAEAEAAGRLGVAQSILGRIRDLAGTATITSRPGVGTEVELRVPRPRTMPDRV